MHGYGQECDQNKVAYQTRLGFCVSTSPPVEYDSS